MDEWVEMNKEHIDRWMDAWLVNVLYTTGQGTDGERKGGVATFDIFK